MRHTMTKENDHPPTSGGVPVTDDDITRLTSEAEAGYDIDLLRRRGGRRPMGSAAADVVPVRLDPELRAALTQRAETDNATTSDVIRQALRAWLHVA
jgi:hypothetical protein